MGVVWKGSGSVVDRMKLICDMRLMGMMVLSLLRLCGVWIWRLEGV